MAGVNYGALHYYFKSKEDILLTFIDKISDMYVSDEKDMFDFKYGKNISLKELVKDLFDYNIKNIPRDLHYANMNLEFYNIDRYDKKVKARLKELFVGFQNNLADLVAKTGIGESKKSNISISLLSYFIGLRVLSNILELDEDIVSAILKDTYDLIDTLVPGEAT
jgi:AcrR family transcriptional regulator